MLDVLAALVGLDPDEASAYTIIEPCSLLRTRLPRASACLKVIQMSEP
jgi:hypothetical protein